jgi:hypothetical protein
MRKAQAATRTEQFKKTAREAALNAATLLQMTIVLTHVFEQFFSP